MFDNRGQAHTLEGFVAALLVLSGVVFALQATAVTPLSASTSNQHIENQQRASAADTLAAADANGTLKQTILAWNESGSRFANTSGTGYPYHTNATTIPTPFGEALRETFGRDRIAFNVYVYYRTPSGGEDIIRLVYQGTPSDNAVSASRVLTLFNDTTLNASSTRVSDPAANYFAQSIDDGPLFNILEVRLVVWRI